ncbi:MAG: DUF3501 family protein [Planctomycetota bacterium]
MSKKLTRESLYPLEKYAEIRTQFRAKVMEHKRHRIVRLGDHATLHFEDRLTMQYQVQEMLRVERIFEAAGIDEELEAYNPLIPDGSNLKATFMIEYADVAERKQALANLIGIEDRVWVQIEGFDPVYAIADEDLERETEEKTSSVHFLRFEFPPEQRAAAKSGASISIGTDHDNYRVSISPLPAAQRDALAADLD